jgi:predicted ATP-grasp superfamily ATP-dependent carboligase
MRSNKNNFKNQHPPVILLGGGVIALSIGRSLARANVRTYVLDDPESEAYFSRHCIGIPIPSSKNNIDGWYEWLLNEGNKIHSRSILIPCSDEGLTLIAQHRAELEKFYNVIDGDDNLILALLDKLKTYDLACKHNIPVPGTWEINSVDDLHKLTGKIKYPCALKPRESHLFTEHFPSLKLFVINSEQELVEKFIEADKFNLKMIVTELIPPAVEGYHSYYTFIDNQGNPLFHFTKLRIRQHPNLFGLGTYNISNWNPEVAELGLRFMKSVGLRGIGTVEFIRDARDGSLKFIECNPRFTGTTALLPLSGLDWPLFVYNYLLGKPLPPTEYKQGVRLFRFASDFLAFRELHHNGKLSWLQWIKSIAYYQHLFYFRWSDPLPFFSRIIPFFKRRTNKILNNFSQK